MITDQKNIASLNNINFTGIQEYEDQKLVEMLRILAILFKSNLWKCYFLLERTINALNLRMLFLVDFSLSNKNYFYETRNNANTENRKNIHYNFHK